ncbi:hypothetical protein [Streptomyces sp. RPT161]|nr:hypothetical protein [Streptomyces sp. RPT161]
MQADAVHTYHWMTDSQCLNAVAPVPDVLAARRRERSRICSR